MLAKANRITSADDYRSVVRRGVKFVGVHTVSYVRTTPADDQARFGFIVSKKIGTAVRRNLVRRRLKAASHEQVVAGARGLDVVVRALPRSADSSWGELRAEVTSAIERQRTPR